MADTDYISVRRLRTFLAQMKQWVLGFTANRNTQAMSDVTKDTGISGTVAIGKSITIHTASGAQTANVMNADMIVGEKPTTNKDLASKAPTINLVDSMVMEAISDAFDDITTIEYQVINNASQLPAMGTNGVIYLAAIYSEVENPTGNPHDLGYYTLSNNVYTLTSDTSVQSGTTYYKKEDAYDEYIWLTPENRYEKLGQASIDISGLKFAGSATSGGSALQSEAIPFGSTSSTSSATAFLATVNGITELKDGTCLILKNTKVTSAAATSDPKCFTLNVNGLGAKKVYVTTAAATYATTQFALNYKYLFVFDSSLDSGNGGWYIGQLFNTNDNTLAYNIRRSYSENKMYVGLYRYQICLTKDDDKIVPVYLPPNPTSTASTQYSTGTAKILTEETFNPWGTIWWYSTTTTVSAGSAPGASYMWDMYSLVDIRYSFNTGSTLVANHDVFMKCEPQDTGFARLHNYIVKTPTTSNPKTEGLFEKSYQSLTVSTGNPKMRGWFKKVNNEYVLAVDTSVVEGTTYYQQKFAVTTDTSVNASKTYYQKVNPITQELPTTDDGLIYVRLGRAYDTYRFSMDYYKPVYYFKEGKLRLWVNQTTPKYSSDIFELNPEDELKIKSGAITKAMLSSSVQATLNNAEREKTLIILHSVNQDGSNPVFKDTSGNTIANTTVKTLLEDNSRDIVILYNFYYYILQYCEDLIWYYQCFEGDAYVFHYLSITLNNEGDAVSNVSYNETHYAASNHTHGNIKNDGTLQANDVTIANGDKLVVTDSSNSSKVARTSIAFDGSTTTQALSKKGTWETFYQKPSGGIPSTDLASGVQTTINDAVRHSDVTIEGHSGSWSGTATVENIGMHPSSITFTIPNGQGIKATGNNTYPLYIINSSKTKILATSTVNGEVSWANLTGESVSVYVAIDDDDRSGTFDFELFNVGFDSAIEGLQEQIGGKQDTISDLATIRSGASKGATAIQPTDIKDELDPGGNGEIADSAAIAAYIDEVTLSTFTLTLTASHPIGWYRVMGLGQYFSGVVTLSGAYYNASPSIATFVIGARSNDTANDIVQINGSKNTNIDKIRLVSNENGDHKFYLDIHKATAAECNKVVVTFNGYALLTDEVTNTVLADVASTYIRKTFDLINGSSFGNITASKFITSGGTSSQFIKGDGTLDSNTYATRDNAVCGGDYITNSNSANTGSTKKDIFINHINDRLYAANSRFYVTHKVFDSSDDSFVKDLSTNVFSGNLEQHGNTISEGQYAELYIGTEPEATLGTNSSMLWTYGNEVLYLTFYIGRYPDSIDEAKLYHKYNPAGWDSCTITKISSAVYKIVLPNKTYPAAIKIKWSGSSSRLVSLSDVKAFGGRSTLNTEGVVTKYGIKQDLWGDVEAPKFIKRGGTSSQFLKADGSVDSNTYLTSHQDISGKVDYADGTKTTTTKQMGTTAVTIDGISMYTSESTTYTIQKGYTISIDAQGTSMGYIYQNSNSTILAQDPSGDVEWTNTTGESVVVKIGSATSGENYSVTIFKKGYYSTIEELTEKIEEAAASGVQADWDESDADAPAYIKNKPTVYTKPLSGIPKSDLANAVQTSLGKADSAVQSVTISQSSAVGTGGTTIQVDNGNAYPIVSDGEPQGSDNGYVAPTWGAMKTLLGDKVDSVELVKHKTDESDESYDTCQTDLFVDDISLGTIVATAKPVTSQRPYVAPSWQGFEEKLSEKSDKSNTYTKSEVDGLVSGINNNVIIGELPTTGQLQNRIYRVPGTNSYTDWAWNGSSWVKLAEFSGSIFMQITETEYDALSDSEKNNGTWYFIEEE